MSARSRTGSGILGWTRSHHRILLGAVVISAVVAIPFALSTPSEYGSQARVLIPAEDTVSTGSGQTSAIAFALDDYLDHGFAGDVRDALGERAAEVATITGVQLRDEDIYLVTASAASADDARDAVLAGAETLMAHATKLAADQVERLVEQTRTVIEELNGEIAALEAEQQRVATQLAGAKESLDEARRSGTAAEIAEAKREVEDLQAVASSLQAEHHLLVTRREGLADLVAQADRDLVTYESVGTLVSGPTTPVRAAPARIVLTFVLAIAAGLAVAVAMILVLERRRRPTPAEDR